MVYVIIIGGIVVLILGGMELGQLYARIKAIGVDRPCLAMFVGGTDSATAVFVHKPRWSRSPITFTHGTMEIFRIGDEFALVPSGAPLGRLVVNTRTQPVISVTAQGVTEGEGEIQLSGEDEAGDSYAENSLAVIVADPSIGTLGLYGLAVNKAKTVWSHGTLGNFGVNFFGGARRGLCDQWAEWSANWLNQHNDGSICVIEMCLYGDSDWWKFRHQFVRITMCETGEVFYVDPHKRADDPVIPKDEYEAEFNAPETAPWDIYRRP